MHEFELSTVIPAFNEARRIGRTLAALRDAFERRALRAELIVVDDGSTDDTARIAAAVPLAAFTPRVVRMPENRGKGAALRTGVALTRGRRVLLCDADLSTPIEELRALAARLDQGAAIAIGSRDLPSSQLDPPQPWPRRGAAWVFRLLRRGLPLACIRDTQCGFKLFDGDLARALFAQSQLDGWLIDCEILALAVQRGLRIDEVGVRWCNDPDSRVHIGRDAPRVLSDLRRLRRRFRPKKETKKGGESND